MRQVMTAKRFILILLTLCMVLSAVVLPASASSDIPDGATHIGKVNVDDNLNVRAGAGTNYDVLGKLYPGDTVYIHGDKSDNWYKISFADGFGYVSANYIIDVKEIPNNETPKYDYDADFESNLTAQGFPESYKVLLRELHAAHPNWVFLSDKLTMTFKEAVDAESGVGKSLVQNGVASIPDSWKSMAEGAYNWTSGVYTSYDSGNWVTAERDVVEYFMEPRNFLNERDIFVFLEQSYNPAVQTKEGLQKILNGTFMAGAFPESTYATYADILMEAGKTYGVSPYVLAASILVEQGNKGTGKSISGTVPGYEKYYNYFNIRAYASGNYSAVEYGLLYAKGEGSYGRPWNTHAKSILGGAESYATGYVKAGQDTLYYKKFNVVSPPYYKHQYMTNVQAAYTEAKKVGTSYATIDSNVALTFSIPVYKDMPSENTSKLPTSTGANNYYLTSLSVDGVPVEGFSKFINSYTINASNTSGSLYIEATAPEGATISGIGNVALKNGQNDVVITVTAASGKTAEYHIYLQANLGGWVSHNGKWAYYQNGEMLRNCWIEDSVGKCYIGADGYCVTNGWAKLEDKWIYLDENGHIATDRWAKDSAGWCYLGSDGFCVTNAWRKDSKGWVYLNSNGRMATNTWVRDSVSWCFVGADGYCVTNAWKRDSVGWCYLDANGRLAVNSWRKDSKGWVYLNAAGRMATNTWAKDSVGWCYLGSDGYCVTNVWAKDSRGKCYLDSNGRMVVSKWLTLGGKKYYFNSSGYMVTGKQKIGGKYYKFNSSGVLIG